MMAPLSVAADVDLLDLVVTSPTFATTGFSILSAIAALAPAAGLAGLLFFLLSPSAWAGWAAAVAGFVVAAAGLALGLVTSTDFTTAACAGFDFALVLTGIDAASAFCFGVSFPLDIKAGRALVAA